MCFFLFSAVPKNRQKEPLVASGQKVAKFSLEAVVLSLFLTGCGNHIFSVQRQEGLKFSEFVSKLRTYIVTTGEGLYILVLYI